MPSVMVNAIYVPGVDGAWIENLQIADFKSEPAGTESALMVTVSPSIMAFARCYRQLCRHQLAHYPWLGYKEIGSLAFSTSIWKVSL